MMEAFCPPLCGWGLHLNSVKFPLRSVSVHQCLLIRSEKLQNINSPNFSKFRPEFCSEYSPNVLRSLRASFRGQWRPEKIHQKSPPFFNATFPGKLEEKNHKSFLDSGQSNC